MKLFADTANLLQIEKLASYGAIDGVTTNPSLFAKEPKGDFILMCKQIAEICKSSNIPLSIEVFSESPKDVRKDATSLVDQIGYSGLSIKIPIDIKYMSVINELSADGILINATCGYTANQLTMAANCGARYVSLFYRRAIDANENVDFHLQLTKKFIKNRNLNCEIIAGSIRSPEDILNAWQSGADIVTASPTIIESSLEHQGTRSSIEGFMKDFSTWISK